MHNVYIYIYTLYTHYTHYYSKINVCTIWYSMYIHFVGELWTSELWTIKRNIAVVLKYWIEVLCGKLNEENVLSEKF